MFYCMVTWKRDQLGFLGPKNFDLFFGTPRLWNLHSLGASFGRWHEAIGLNEEGKVCLLLVDCGACGCGCGYGCGCGCCCCCCCCPYSSFIQKRLDMRLVMEEG